MSWVAVAVGVGSAVVGGVAQNNAADKAADAAKAGGDAAIAEQRRQYNLTREDFAPFREAGVDALGRQAAILNGDFSGFQNSPDYLFNFGQGVQALDQSAAARGGLFGGGHSKDLTKFGQGLASTHLNDYWSKLAGLAGQGYNSTSSLGSLGANMANNISGQYNNIANNRASSYLTQGQNNAGMIGALGGGIAQGYGYNSAMNGGGTGWYLGNNPGRG